VLQGKNNLIFKKEIFAGYMVNVDHIC